MPRLPLMSLASTGTPLVTASMMTLAPPSMSEAITIAWLRVRRWRAWRVRQGAEPAVARVGVLGGAGRLAQQRIERAADVQQARLRAGDQARRRA